MLEAFVIHMVYMVCRSAYWHVRFSGKRRHPTVYFNATAWWKRRLRYCYPL